MAIHGNVGIFTYMKTHENQLNAGEYTIVPWIRNGWGVAYGWRFSFFFWTHLFSSAEAEIDGEEKIAWVVPVNM